MKHTPGPWRVEIDGELVGPLGGFMPFGSSCGSPWMTGITKEARKADARLIAAAPELLEALRELLAEAESGIATSPLTRAKARAAIAKAEAGNG